MKVREQDVTQMMSNELEAGLRPAQSRRVHQAPPAPAVKKHSRSLPLRVGTRASPLALWQTRDFLRLLTRFCPVLRGMDAFHEHAISTTGDRVQDRKLAEIGGKGLFAKEIHEALSDGRIDFAVHSLKDLETKMPDGIVLACTLKREDARDAIVLGMDAPACESDNPYAPLRHGAVIGTSSIRRQAQMLHVRPDLQIKLIRGNVQSRLAKVRDDQYDATLLALAGLRRMDLEHEASIVIAPDVMVPAVGQGIVGITVRERDVELRELLAAIEDREARAVSTAERSMQQVLDGSCSTPIGGHARVIDGVLTLTGLVARGDGSFLLKRTVSGSPADAARIGAELGASLRADSPADIFVA